MLDMKSSPSNIDSLTTIPLLNDSAIIENLKKELPTYIAKVDGVSPTTCVLQWWKQHEITLPHWSAAAEKAILIQPSSAAAERVFSLLNNFFNS